MELLTDFSSKSSELSGNKNFINFVNLNSEFSLFGIAR